MVLQASSMIILLSIYPSYKAKASDESVKGIYEVVILICAVFYIVISFGVLGILLLSILGIKRKIREQSVYSPNQPVIRAHVTFITLYVINVISNAILRIEGNPLSKAV